MSIGDRGEGAGGKGHVERGVADSWHGAAGPLRRRGLDSGYFFVGEHKGVVIAYASGVVKVGKYSIFKPEGERYLHVHEVFVHADHREKGVGDRLVATLLSRSESEGINRSDGGFE